MAELPAPQPLPLVFRRPQIARHHEVLGLWLQVLWLPIALFGAMLILTIEGAHIGVALMLLAAPPFLAGRMRHRGGRAPRSLVATGFLAVAIVSASWTWILLSSIRPVDEWWTVITLNDVILVSTLVLWTALASTTIVLAWTRPSFDRHPVDRTAVRRYAGEQ